MQLLRCNSGSFAAIGQESVEYSAIPKSLLWRFFNLDMGRFTTILFMGPALLGCDGTMPTYQAPCASMMTSLCVEATNYEEEFDWEDYPDASEGSQAASNENSSDTSGYDSGECESSISGDDLATGSEACSGAYSDSETNGVGSAL